jgi:hypothetical protein
LTGETPTPWRRFVWIEREKVYLSAIGAKMQREREEMEQQWQK